MPTSINAQRSLVFGHPPKVVWIRTGNCSTADVERLLRTSQPLVAAFLADEVASVLTLM